MVDPVIPVTHSPFTVFSPACFQSPAFPFVVPLVVLPCSGGFSYGQEHCQTHVFSSRALGSSSPPNHTSVQWGRSSIFAIYWVVFFVSQTIAMFHAVPLQSVVITGHHSLAVSL